MKSLHVLGTMAVVIVLGNCSLLEKLTEQEFKVTADFKVDAMAGSFPAFAMPTTPCAGIAECCSPDASATDCAKLRDVLRCDGACSASVPIGPAGATGITLAVRLRDVPALRDATSLADLRISRVWIEIGSTGNSLSVPLPEVSVYVATTETNATEVKLGHVPMLKLKDTGEFDVEFTAEGEKELATFLSNAGSPFNLILRSAIPIPAGQRVTGALSGKVAIQAKAKVNL